MKFYFFSPAPVTAAQLAGYVNGKSAGFKQDPPDFRISRIECDRIDSSAIA